MYDPTLFLTIRKFRKLTLEDLAPAMKLTAVSLSRKERGLHAWTIDELKRAALLLDVTLPVLLGLEDLVIEAPDPLAEVSA